MTNTIKILIARENSHKKMEASNYYLEFSTIEELEDKLLGLPYSQKIKSILRLKRHRVEDFTKTFVINTEEEFEAIRYHIDCNLVIEEKRLSNEERLKIKLKREQQNNKVLEKAKDYLYRMLYYCTNKIEIKLKDRDFDVIFTNRRGGNSYRKNDETNFLLVDKGHSKFYVYTGCNGFTEIKDLKTTKRIFAQKPIDTEELSNDDIAKLTKYVEKIYKNR